MQAFSYTAPGTVEGVLDALSAHATSGERAQVLAGGTDMLVQLRGRDRAPRAIVDIKKLAETNAIEIGADNVFVGACVPAAVLSANSQLQALLPGLVEAVDLIGSAQIQGRASIGGNLCNASPAGDTIPVLIANQGSCRIASPAGTRELAVEDFVVDVQKNVLAADEFLLGIDFPRPTTNTADAYLRFIPRTEMDIAVAGAGVSITVDNGTCTAARVAIGAVARTALLVPAAAAALIGTGLSEAVLVAAQNAASDAAQPISDKRGTAEYRKKVVGVLVRRAIERAIQRLQESTS